MNKTIEIEVPKEKVDELQTFLNSKGEDKVETIETFTAKFGDDGEGNIEVDIKVCQGNPPFVDAVIFQDNNEIGCLEVSDELVGEYIFSCFVKNTYTVIIKSGK